MNTSREATEVLSISARNTTRAMNCLLAASALFALLGISRMHHSKETRPEHMNAASNKTVLDIRSLVAASLPTQGNGLPAIDVFCKQFEHIQTYSAPIQAIEAQIPRAPLTGAQWQCLCDLKLARVREEAHYNETARRMPIATLRAHKLPKNITEHIH